MVMPRRPAVPQNRVHGVQKLGRAQLLGSIYIPPNSVYKTQQNDHLCTAALRTLNHSWLMRVIKADRRVGGYNSYVPRGGLISAAWAFR